MAASKQIVELSPETKRHVLLYATKAHELLLNQFSLRSNLEVIDRYYMRENNWSLDNVRAKIANRIGDVKQQRMQDVTVPIVMPQVNAALGYLVNVFLTGYPVFGVAGDVESENAALQMSTVIAENAIYYQWCKELIMFFRDGLKYNLHAVECEWVQNTVARLENDPTADNGAKAVETLVKGNRIKRMDMYNSFFDPRVHPTDIHRRGEYAGYIEMYTRLSLLQLVNDQYGAISKDVIDEALATGPAPGGQTAQGSPFSYYMPLINPWPIMNRYNQQTVDWMAWSSGSMMNASSTIKYNNVYEVTKLYARIIPEDFGINKVPQKNVPQVWKFIIVNGQVVLFAERQTNVHNYIPIFFGQPIEDGLDYQTKSFATNVSDFQDIASTLWSGYLASKRRLVGDRVLYDPSRVRQKDIESVNPTAKIPVRPSAYGKSVGESVFQFPFRDEQQQTMLDGAERVSRFADMVNGQNPAARGQFVKGNKTLHEYDDVMGHGNSDNQVMAISTEVQVFTPLKEVIKLNILQFQDETTMFNRDQGVNVKIKPTELRQAAVHFKVSDGMLPQDKEMSTEEFSVALQVLGSSPQLAGAYNMAPLFTYIMKLRGADLDPFEKPQWQVMYEQQMQAWQQAAAMAAQKGTPFSTPQPQLPPQLQQMVQQQQQAAGGASPDGSGAEGSNVAGAAAESTQGEN